MGHSIQAIVAKSSQFSADPIAKAATISLPQDFAMLLTDEYTGLDCPSEFTTLGRRLSFDGAVAYVATAYHGGSGSQAAGVWRDGSISGAIEEGSIGTINGALASIGVRRTDGLDEFDSIGLGRYRDHDNWRDFAREGKASYERKPLNWPDWFGLAAVRRIG